MAGPKKVVCSICGEEILKSQTYHIGDGKRACKKHEGVEGIKNDLQQKEKEKRKKSMEKKNKHRQESVKFKEFDNKCACCLKKGIQKYEYITNFLYMKKMYEIIMNEIVFNPSKDFNDKYKEFLMIHYGYIPVSLIIINPEKFPKRVLHEILKTPLKSLIINYRAPFKICDQCIKENNLYKLIGDEISNNEENMKNFHILSSLVNDVIEKDVRKILDENTDEKKLEKVLAELESMKDASGNFTDSAIEKMRNDLAEWNL